MILACLSSSQCGPYNCDERSQTYPVNVALDLVERQQPPVKTSQNSLHLLFSSHTVCFKTMVKTLFALSQVLISADSNKGIVIILI